MSFDALPANSDPAIDQRNRDLAILQNARNNLAKPGAWCQHATTVGDSHCAIGWLGIAVQALSEYHPGSLVDRCFTHLLPKPSHSLPHYNDATGRTQADMVALFDRAIERLQSASAAP